ncbi:MAG: hypothetical protein D6737_13300 [Chloroflexi bacterium]|nr:MAG: hypothetical protein D6737_13300 [Chloroflexota bacterium]
MTTYQMLTWHGIPTGVKAKDEHGEARQNLPIRFQAAVDAVATAVGHTETTAYLAGWQWSEPAERDGSAEEVARAVADELVAEYSPERIKALRHEIEQRLRVDADH